MCRGLLMIALALGLGCGGDPASSPASQRAAHEALLQRLDAMEQRLDRLEDAQQPSLAEPRTPSRVDELVPPDRLRTQRGVTGEPKLRLTVTATGLELDGERFERAAALAHLLEIARLAPETRLTVLSEPDVPYAVLIDALDLAREAGLHDIAMSARIHGEGDGEDAAGED